jgi:hypothetical protein
VSHRANTLAIAIAVAVDHRGLRAGCPGPVARDDSGAREPLESYDIGIVNEQTHLYYRTDRSNKSIEIFG